MITGLKKMVENVVNMRISKKLILGYLLLIVLPFLIFSYFIYYQIYEKLVTQYQLTNQQNIEQMAGNLDASLGKIESLYSIYQNNAALISFLRGEYTNDRDLIYAYLKEIRPAFSFSYLADPLVDEINIYPKNQNRLLSITGFKNYNDIMNNLNLEELSSLSPANGVWKRRDVSQSSSLVYYHRIYSDSYTNDLGIIEIKVSPQILDDFLHSLKTIHPDGDLLLLQQQDNSVVYHSGNMEKNQIDEIKKEIVANQKDNFPINKGQLLINFASLPRIQLTVVEVNQKNAIFTIFQKQYLWVAGGIILLMLLTILYYLIVSFMTRRIVLLSRHMRREGLDSLKNHYTGKIGKDEIGFLISNYNAMITRMDELVHRVKRVERLKKEANFKMLQAQIQPHFLYNTLETMRMLARADHNKTLADMAYSLGSLLRYSLSNKSDSTIQEEFEHVRGYIDIHQIRMRELNFELFIEPTVPTIQCPRFILQPLVENSLMHGLSKKRGPKKISVRISMDSNYAVIEVEDNGVGMTEERLAYVQSILHGNEEREINEDNGMGIGISNVNERIKAYFNHDSELNITSNKNEGTRCTVKLYLKENRHVEVDDRG